MDRPRDRADWLPFTRGGFRVHFRYPAVTPGGRAVDRTEDHHGDAARVHLTTPDRQELYVEVIKFPNLAPREEYSRHRPHLEQRFGAGSTSPLSEANLGDLPAWAYDFWWEQGERSVLLLQVAADTYRIIYDPRSPLNLQILATITIAE